MEQEITKFIGGLDKNLLSVLITSVIAFVCWIVKGLIELPLTSSKEVFFKYFDKRIELLGDVKVRLSIIAYFPGEESLPYKEQLQELLLTDGKSAYLDSDILAGLLDISIDKNTNEDKLIKLLENVNTSLSSQINKVQQLNNFYSKYSNVDPLKRIISFSLLSIYYILIVVSIVIVTSILFYVLVTNPTWVKLLTICVVTCLILGINKWLQNSLK